MAKGRRPLLLPALIILASAGVFFYFAARVQGFEGLLPKAFFPRRQISVSWSVLEEIRNLHELETAAYDMKVVFPFDFTGEEPVDWAYLKGHYDREPSLFRAKIDPAWHPGGRLPEKWKYAGIYDLCRSVGMDPGRPDYRFVVVSVAVHAGVDLESWLAGFTLGENDGDVDGIEVIEGDDGSTTLRLTVPPVDITSFVVQDRDTASEGFPDVPLSPANWKELTYALEPGLTAMALSGGLLEKADQEAQDLLEGIFVAAGFSYVEFIE